MKQKRMDRKNVDIYIYIYDEKREFTYQCVLIFKIHTHMTHII